MEIILSNTYMIASYLALFVVLFTVSKLIKEFLTPYAIDEQITEKDNLALAVSLAGYFIGVIIIFVGAMIGPSYGLSKDLSLVGGYSLLGIVLLNIARLINDFILLPSFSSDLELIRDQNAGVGLVQFGGYIGSALMIAGAISGEGGGFLTAVTFFFLGQLSLLIMSKIYARTVTYDVHAELEKDNVAAGFGFAGTLIAVGVILLSSLSGPFISWSKNLSYFAIDSLIGFAVLPIFRFLFDKFVIPKADLNHEIKHDQNLGAGLLEMTMTVGFAVVLLIILKD